MDRTVHCLIVDQSSAACDSLHKWLDAERGIEVVAKCSSGREAVHLIGEFSPDLVFLEIELSDLSGFEVAAQVGPQAMPATVFLSESGQHALGAFEMPSVLDYLVKPIDRKRVRTALDKCRGFLIQKSGGAVNRQLRTLLSRLRHQKKFAERLLVKSLDGTLKLVEVQEIDWVDAAGKTLRLNMLGEVCQLRETMSSLIERLDPSKFVRIHRSTIVNVSKIREIRRRDHGGYLVVLQCGKRLNVSRGQRAAMDLLLAEHGESRGLVEDRSNAPVTVALDSSID